MKFQMKQNKVYKFTKMIFYKIINIFLEIINLKNRGYYYSKWVSDSGDEKLYTKYPLTTKSLVLDIGGYTGRFSDQIILRYNPHIVIYEPVRSFYQALKNKYYTNNLVRVVNVGLSNKKSSEKIRVSGDGTSIYRNDGKMETIRLVDAAVELNKYKIIDLISINIEGGEYDVIERLIKIGVIKKINFLQVQFHSFVPNSINRRKDLLKTILKTHDVYYSYPFVWESFKLRH